jgi:hypothetical protein
MAVDFTPILWKVIIVVFGARLFYCLEKAGLSRAFVGVINKIAELITKTESIEADLKKRSVAVRFREPVYFPPVEGGSVESVQCSPETQVDKNKLAIQTELSPKSPSGASKKQRGAKKQRAGPVINSI